MFSKSLKVMAASVAMSAVALGVSAHEVRAEHVATNDWTGPYIGAIIGIGTVDANLEVASASSGSFESLSDYGFMGGLTVGWNVQDGHLVYGIEGDVSFGEVDSTTDLFSGTLTLDTDLFATIRGRVGVASNDIFIYGTAGLAILDGEVTLAGFGPTETEGFTALGGVVGAGAELAITPDVSFKAELLYAIFDESLDFGFGGGGSEVDIENFYTVRFGVNWHF